MKQQTEIVIPAEVVEHIAESLDTLGDEDGYTQMGKLGNLLVKKQPDFDPRNYGFSKLSKLIKALDRFEIQIRQEDTDIYVRRRDGGGSVA